VSDIDRLTIVVACLGLMLLERVPERDVSDWGFVRLTLNLFVSFVLMVGVLFPVLNILGWRI
jgi:hypothetical protein